MIPGATEGQVGLVFTACTRKLEKKVPERGKWMEGRTRDREVTNAWTNG